MTINDSQGVDGYQDYYPFGKIMPGRSYTSGNLYDNYKFTGHERDDEFNLTLDYMQARMYDPVIGRFLSVDPLSDLYPAWSPYTYTLNNPVNFIDPTGLCPEDGSEGENQHEWGNGETCLEAIEVTAPRYEGESGFVSGGGAMIFNVSTVEGREGLFNHFYNNPAQIPSFVSNDNFSLEAKHQAMRASRARSNKTFGIYAYHITAQSLSIASFATGVGAVGLGLKGLSSISARGIASQLSTASFTTSGAEFGLRAAGYTGGIDSAGNFYSSAIGVAGSGVLKIPAVRGVTFNTTKGPIFRSMSSGRFVSNKYGLTRYGITTTGQIGVLSIPFIY